MTLLHRLRPFALATFWSSMIAATVLGQACSDDTGNPPPANPTHAVYGDAKATQLVPFPSDRYTKPDASTATGRRVEVSADTTGDSTIGGFPLVAQRLGEMDGFSTSGGFAIGFDHPIDGSALGGPQGGVDVATIDPASFSASGTPLVLIDVDPASPDRGKVFGLLPRYFEQAKDDYYLIDEFTIIARPSEPLAPGRRYLFAATNKILDKDGNPVAATDETTALLTGDAKDDYTAEVQDGLAVLENAGIQRDTLAVVSVFTTASITDEMVALASRQRALPPPAIVDDWTIEMEPGAGDDRIRFRATYDSPEYRRKDGDGTFEIGDDGAPVSQVVVPLEVFLTFSDKTQSGPRPIVIFQHGLGGDKDGCWGTTERLAELGVAVIAIDSPEHGSRGSGADSVLTSALAFFGIDGDTGAFDIARARDNFRQMAADQLELVRLVDSLGSLDLLPVGAPDGIPDLDVSRILYIGHSFGSVQGPTIFAMAPEIQQAVWNVGGDNLTELLQDSGVFSLMVKSMTPPGTADGTLARFFGATQAIVDPGDPVNYARFALQEPMPGVTGFGPRSVLLQEVVGDNIVPNSSSDAIARATGLSVMNPVAPPPGLTVVQGPSKGQGPSGSTAVMCQYLTMDGMPATHGELIFSEEARAQYVEFFRSGIQDGTSTVVAPVQ